MENGKLDVKDRPATQLHIQILQSIIGRMASNSANCKTWCITIVAAILALAVDKGSTQMVLVAGIPVLLFFLLDAYYLSLEKHFVDEYGLAVNKMNSGDFTLVDAFVVGVRLSDATKAKNTMRAVRSISVWPFYSILAAAMVALGSLLWR